MFSKTISKEHCSEMLRNHTLRFGKVLENGILKVDSFLNHQIDSALMFQIGAVIAEHFRDSEITKILTVESSGIAPALATGMFLSVPVVFARKKKPITMGPDVFTGSAPSHTKGGVVNLYVSSEFLTEKDRIIIVDDFLASGKTIGALAGIVETSGARLLGIVSVIEKTFEEGREFLSSKYNVPIISLLRIASLDCGRITFED